MRHTWLNGSNYIASSAEFSLLDDLYVFFIVNVLSIVNPRNLVDRALGINLLL